jgi:hypothetical protein
MLLIGFGRAKVDGTQMTRIEQMNADECERRWNADDADLYDLRGCELL